MIWIKIKPFMIYKQMCEWFDKELGLGMQTAAVG